MEHETIHTQKMKADFPFFGIVSGIYAVFYTFCMYRNASGITLPFFTAGSLLFCFLCMRRLGISAKKDVLFYAAGLMLLSISSFCTADGTILFFNQAGMLLLTVCLLIHQFYDDKEWGFGKYFCAFFQTIFGTIGSIVRPFTDGFAWKRARTSEAATKCAEHGSAGNQSAGAAAGTPGNKKGKYVLFGLLLSCPLVLIVGILLITSDAVIFEMFRSAFEDLFATFGTFEFIVNCVKFVWNVTVILTMTIGMFFAAYGVFAYLGKRKIKEEVRDVRSGEPVIMITVTGVLSVIYLLYSVVQILYLFIGKMSLPAGYTYAEYAREGFFQLLVVCIINLILVLISIRYFKQSKVLQTILTIVSVCTYIMMASSALRMIMYIRFYYLTYLRILVLWTLAVLFILLTGLVITIFKEKFPLFRYSIVVVTLCYLILAFAHPDYWIAKINVQNIGEVQDEFFLGEPYEDYWYLGTLSLDAAPALRPVLEDGDEGFLGFWTMRHEADLRQTDWRKFNLSGYLAGRQYEEMFGERK